MNDSPIDRLDWSLVQSFLAVVEHGSLARAAQATGQSQPTLGRQIAALEEMLQAACSRAAPAAAS